MDDGHEEDGAFTGSSAGHGLDDDGTDGHDGGDGTQSYGDEDPDDGYYGEEHDAGGEDDDDQYGDEGLEDGEDDGEEEEYNSQGENVMSGDDE